MITKVAFILLTLRTNVLILRLLTVIKIQSKSSSSPVLIKFLKPSRGLLQALLHCDISFALSTSDEDGNSAVLSVISCTAPPTRGKTYREGQQRKMDRFPILFEQY